MRILIISTEALETPPKSYGGIEWITFWLTKALHELGHQVGLVALEGSRVPYKEIPLYTILQKYEKYASLLMAERIERIVEEFKPDIVNDHSHGKACFKVLKEKKIPYVPSSHTVGIPDLGEPKPCWTALSKSHARTLKRGYGVECRVCYNGIEYPDKPITRWKAKTYPPIALGRPNPEKGILDVIDFCKKYDIPLNVVCGRLEYEQIGYAFNVAQECKWGSKWVYHGQVSHEKKMSMLAQSKCMFNFPMWEEPFGLVVPEANWVGTPVITIAMGAMPELVENGKTGYVIDVERNEYGDAYFTKNVWGFPRAVFDEQKVLDAYHNIQSLDLEYVAEYVRKRFNIHAMAEQYLKVYESVLDRGERW